MDVTVQVAGDVDAASTVAFENVVFAGIWGYGICFSAVACDYAAIEKPDGGNCGDDGATRSASEE